MIPILGDILKGVFGTVKDLASEVIVDKDKRNEILFKVKELEDKADSRLHDELMGQIDVNKQEAAHPSIFVAGWRPAIGWVGAIGLGYSFVIAPFISIFTTVPELDTGSLMTLVLSMLGIGAQRTYEKVKGVATESVSKLGAKA